MSPFARASILACVALLSLVLALRPGYSKGALSRHPDAVGLGRHWQLVFIGSAECGPCNDPRLLPAVRTIVAELEFETRAVAHGFRTLEVAIDEDHPAARDFLKRFGSFDEVSVGGGPFSSGALRFLLREGNGGGTPTLVLLRRDVEMDARGGFNVSDDSTRFRLEGLDAILDFSGGLGGMEPAPRSSAEQQLRLTRPQISGDGKK